MKLVYDVGINDADYVTQIKETIGHTDGKRKQKVVWICPYYRTWASMLNRCYSDKKYPTYKGCTVCDEWLIFSKFKSWMDVQDWEGKQLDKDILFPDNKAYRPETCVFVDSSINTFIIESGVIRGEYPIGVYWAKRGEKFKAQISNPFTGKREYLGYFTDPQEAHQAWLKRKLELAKLLAEEQADPRVAKALIERYENYIGS